MFALGRLPTAQELEDALAGATVVPDSVGLLTLDNSPNGIATFPIRFGDDFAISISAAPVPLPATAWLLCSAMGVIGLLRRR